MRAWPVVVLLACRPPIPEAVEPIARTGARPAEARAAALEAEARWPGRADESELRAAIAGWTRAVTFDDADTPSYTMLARASFTLADGFLALAPERRDEARARFDDGATFADRGLRALSAEYEARRQAGRQVDEAAATVGPAAGPLLYWWALCTIRRAELDGTTALLRWKGSVLRAVELAARLDPGVDRGGPDRFLGAWRAAAPSIAGGDLALSREHFGRALRAAPTSLETRLQLARFYARRAGARSMYAGLLREIETMPAVEPEDQLAKKKARLLPGSL